jgi:hypothetical protein
MSGAAPRMTCVVLTTSAAGSICGNQSNAQLCNAVPRQTKAAESNAELSGTSLGEAVSSKGQPVSGNEQQQ